MPNHQCFTCKRNFKQKSHLNDHINKKNKCHPANIEILTVSNNNQKVSGNNDIPIITIPKLQNVNPTAQLLNINQNTEPNLDNDITCDYCNKTFARKNALYKHIKESCKVIKEQNKIKQDIFEKLLLLEEKNKQLEDEIKNNKIVEEENKKLKDEIKNIQTVAINNNNSINTINSNNTTNNTININITPHGEENLSKYSNLMLVLAAKRGINAVLELTDRIHFNSQLPEFQNVYIPDIKNKHAMVFDKVWELKNTDEVISNIYDTKSDFIRDNKDVFFDHLSVGEQAVYQRWENANKNTPEYKLYIDTMHEKIKLLLYNKRNMVIATKKLQANNNKSCNKKIT